MLTIYIHESCHAFKPSNLEFNVIIRKLFFLAKYEKQEGIYRNRTCKLMLFAAQTQHSMQSK